MVFLLNFESEIGIFLRHFKIGAKVWIRESGLRLQGAFQKKPLRIVDCYAFLGLICSPTTSLRRQFVQGFTPRSLYSFSYACITELVKLLITKCKLNINIKRLTVDNVIMGQNNMSSFTPYQETVFVPKLSVNSRCWNIFNKNIQAEICKILRILQE